MFNPKYSSKSNAKGADSNGNGNVNSGRTVGKLHNDDSGIPPTVTTAATDIESEASSAVDLEIQDIEGIGPTTEKKLKKLVLFHLWIWQ
jgi:predicted flap endonuclease-1-like 5' DNA nuclease